MTAAPFDTLKLARALRDKAGFSQEHAEAAADALADVVAEQVATKQDLKDLGSGLQAGFGALRAEVHSEIAALRAELHSEIAALRAELHSEIAALRTEITAGLRDVEQPLTIRLGGMLVVVTGILLAAKFFG